MLCKDVMYEIEKEYPLNYALSWDNVGLLVGRDDKEVKRIYIALDATDEVIDEAVRTAGNQNSHVQYLSCSRCCFAQSPCALSA